MALVTAVGCSTRGSGVDDTSSTSTRSSLVQVSSTIGSRNFVLASPVMKDGGTLPAEFTCDGESQSPPLTWSGAPDGTQSFAVLMDHQPGPGDWHWYWILWGIPSSTSSIAAGSAGGAVVGTNSMNRELAYAPPCSQGPGEKAYTITVFALSKAPDISDPATIDRAAFLDAVRGITLGQSSMIVKYTRP